MFIETNHPKRSSLRKERNVSFAHKWPQIKKPPVTINSPCLTALRAMLNPFDFLQRRHTTLAHGRVARRFANARRVVPATFAFLPVGVGYSYAYFLVSKGRIGTRDLHLRDDENVAQLRFRKL